MSKSGVRGVRLGGVVVIKCDVGFEEGATSGAEEGVSAEGSSGRQCSVELEDGLVRSLDTAFVIETFGGTRAS